ncbi:hypothetical protein CEXT_531351 [Caerostris extrusa]|uniref:Uncharacterized protein n=1 Tax=Caerostris extrusa TaxID=172846 RepID=A0AAV4Y1V2_CAEEX|nr:hypothetical protein CEXT_531351 [Caerostris extrusa]
MSTGKANDIKHKIICTSCLFKRFPIVENRRFFSTHTPMQSFAYLCNCKSRLTCSNPSAHHNRLSNGFGDRGVFIQFRSVRGLHFGFGLQPDCVCLFPFAIL